ncbi:MAG: hypothetical protein AAFV53_24360 [Myxococcota bacterium]
MFQTPPEDDARWRALLEHFDATLGDSMFPEDAAADNLLDGVREAMNALESMGFSMFEQDAPASLTVVDGGLPDDAPLIADARPALRLVEAPIAEDDHPAARPWLGVDDDTEEIGHLGFSGQMVPPSMGHISLSAGEQQTLLLSSTPRAYRLFCQDGALQVCIDGASASPLRAGQSLDVEACRIVVTAPYGAQGHYARL